MGRHNKFYYETSAKTRKSIAVRLKKILRMIKSQKFVHLSVLKTIKEDKPVYTKSYHEIVMECEKAIKTLESNIPIEPKKGRIFERFEKLRDEVEYYKLKNREYRRKLKERGE